MNDKEWQTLRSKAQKISRKEYSTEASSIIRLTKEEIASIIKKAKVNNKALSDLISVVNDASKSNKQKANDIKNTTGLAEVAVSLIEKLV